MKNNTVFAEHLANSREKGVAAAIKKMRYFSGDEWCGHLTPSEILDLAKNGCKFDEISLSSANDDKKNGVSSPCWVYCCNPPKPA